MSQSGKPQVKGQRLTRSSRVLVTGGGGFVGSHAAEYYARKGYEVTAFDNLSRAQTLGKHVGDVSYNWNYLKRNCPSVRLVMGDIRDFQAIKEASRCADLIIHTAGQVAVTTSVNDPRTDFEINAIGTLNLLEAARQADAAVVFCSTNKVYGDNVNSVQIREDQSRYVITEPEYMQGIPESFPIDRTGHSPYGSSKLSADIYVQDYFHTYGMKTGVFRMSCIYGERQSGVEDQGWVSWLTIATQTNRPTTIFGNGKQVRDVLYVQDLVDAFDRFLTGNLRHEVFNMGGGPENTLSLIELLEMLKELTGKSPRIRYANWRTADQKIYISDIRRAQTQLQWKPTTNPREGVEKLNNWVRDNLSMFE